MSEDAIEVEAETVTNNQLTRIVNESGLEKTKADYILEKFQDFFKMAGDWERKAKTLVVTNETQTTEMKMAREGRLFLKNKRVEIEKVRKDLKEQSLREGRAIDGIANVLKGLIEPTEDFLERQEKFVEVQENERRERRKIIRISEVQELGLDPLAYNLKDMTDENYKNLIEGRKAFLKQEEEQRIAREKEEQRIRDENEKLRKESEEKEKQLQAERAKAEKERLELEKQMAAERARTEKQQKENEAKLAKERAEAEARENKLRKEQEAKLKKEREERERLEAEIKAKAEKERLEKERLAKEEAKAKRAPDKEKLLAFAEQVNELSLPIVKTADAAKILSNGRKLLNEAIEYIRKEAKQL